MWRSVSGTAICLPENPVTVTPVSYTHLDVINHPLETWTLEICPTPSVVNVLVYNGQPMLLSLIHI